ncbi:MAG: hypothetical protein PHW04_16935 [Candidatus Wallbacteria bacterium]|nr:hypothetical protein [Candidatus Wallbacteria bacterium]
MAKTEKDDNLKKAEESLQKPESNAVFYLFSFCLFGGIFFISFILPFLVAKLFPPPMALMQ